MLRCAVCYHWMAHVALIVVYIEFAEIKQVLTQIIISWKLRTY